MKDIKVRPKEIYTLISPKIICKFNEILIKTPNEYLMNVPSRTLKFICESKRPRIAETILKTKK